MSNFLFNEDISYHVPMDDPIHSFFKDEEEQSTETPFSLNSESPIYNSNLYQQSNLNMEDMPFAIGMNPYYAPLNNSNL